MRKNHLSPSMRVGVRFCYVHVDSRTFTFLSDFMPFSVHINRRTHKGRDTRMDKKVSVGFVVFTIIHSYQLFCFYQY